MNYLLDTNICSAFLKRPGALAHRFLQHSGGLAIPTIVLAELYTWAYRRSNPALFLQSLENDLLNDLEVLDFDSKCAKRFGHVRATMLATGLVVNPLDLMIASVALTHDCTMVTHNIKHFEFIPDLRIEDWLEN